MKRTVTVLWLTLAASLAASWLHLATLFARHEYPGWWPVAALAATAVDLGILAAMMAIGDMASEGRSTSGPRWTVAGLVALSCMANAAHVLAVASTAGQVETALAVGVAASLPLIVWRLSLLLDALRRPVPPPAPSRPAPVSPATSPAKRQPVATTARLRVPMAERVEQLTAVEGEFPGAADSEIAGVMGVDPRTVRRIRQAREQGQVVTV